MAPAGYPQQQMAPPQMQQPYPTQYPQQYQAAPPPYYPPPAGPKFNIGILVAIGLILAAVGFMMIGGMYLWQNSIKNSGDYKTMINMMGAGWLMVGIGLVLMAVVEFLKAMKKA